MTPFDHDFDWQRGLLPAVKRVLANYLISEAPAEEDKRHNTDLIVLRLDTIRVACRLRRYRYAHDFSDEFTIRSGRPSGVDTELSKVLSGWGDYIFYGFANETEDELAAWTLGDLSEFRLWHQRQTWDGNKPGSPRQNGDGSSSFRAYRVAELPADFVVARMPLHRRQVA